MSAANRRTRSLVPWILGITVASVATGNAGAEPAQLPALEPTIIDVDVTSLPTSEKAALARIVHAGRLMDALYLNYNPSARFVAAAPALLCESHVPL
jgi:hypothetical protein